MLYVGVVNARLEAALVGASTPLERLDRKYVCTSAGSPVNHAACGVFRMSEDSCDKAAFSFVIARLSKDGGNAAKSEAVANSGTTVRLSKSG